MRRALRWIGGLLSVLFGVPLALVVAAFLLANTGFGRQQIEQWVPYLSGDLVRLQGLTGRFPDALRIERLEVRDSKGAYLTVEDAALDWAPTRLLSGRLLIDLVEARRVAFERLPEPAAEQTPASTSPGLPVHVSLHRLHVARFELGEAVAGQAATLEIEARAALEALDQGEAHAVVSTVVPRDGGEPDRYTIDALVGPERIRAEIRAREAPSGLIAGLAALPGLGAVTVDALLDGPRDALATRIAVAAGPLRAGVQGSVDLVHEGADLSVTASAPAMQPRDDVAWQSVALDATVSGPFARPKASGTLRIEDLRAGGARVGVAAADIAGDAGEVRASVRMEQVILPAPRPDLLAAGPVVAQATVRLDQPNRPVTFSVQHPLLSAEGTGDTAPSPRVRATVTLPRLAPLADLGGVDLQGRARLTIDAEQTGDQASVAVTGTVAATGGMPMVQSLVGDAGTIDLAASMRGQDVTVQRLALGGRAFQVTAQGGLVANRLGLDWAVRLTDLAAVHPTVSGPLDAQGRAEGPLNDLSVTAEISGDVAAQGVQSGRFTARIAASGLPDLPSATVVASGTLLDAPLSLSLAGELRRDQLHVAIREAEWKSLRAGGDVMLATGQTIPTGQLRLSMERLADFAPLLGQPITGRIAATLDSDTAGAQVTATLLDVTIPGTAALNRADLAATVSDPAGSPSVDGALTLDGVAVSGLRGGARINVRGPAEALAINLSANMAEVMGSPVRLETAGVLDAHGRKLALNALQADWQQQTLRLLAPARIAFADGVEIDRLRLGLRQAELAISGRAGATLDLAASLRNLPADIVAMFAPDLAADGTITGDVRLTGTPARPEGTVRVAATGVRLRGGPGQALPPANLTADATLQGQTARVDTRLAAGTSRLAVTGTVPLGTAGAMDLRGNGMVDLAVLDPIVAAGGRRVRGRVSLDAGVTGPFTAPNINGTARLANGDIQDFALGARVTNITATVQAEGDTIRLTQFSGQAGPGTIGATGSLGITGAMPVTLRLTANNARPIASDLLTALIDASLALDGEVNGNLLASGTLRVRRADIRIPERLPASIATIPVRVAGAPPAPPPAPTQLPDIALNIVLDAPGQIFIRGRGLDAELGGKVTIQGTAANPQPSGGLFLRRGTFSVIGQTLALTEGTIDFSGGGLTNPSLKLVATSTSGNLIARLTISGSARDPKVTLSSVPEMPQDEILAQLLFNSTTARLSPFQIAQIGAALAELSGATGGIGDPLENLRKAFGLDRLSVGSSSTGAPTLEAGRYVAPGVYMGARQSTTGGGSQATVQVDITRGLKLEATAGSGTSSAVGSASARDAASVGLTYQFEY